MRILVIVHSNSSTVPVIDKKERYDHSPYTERLESILNTWSKNVLPPHKFVISGDAGLYNKYPDKEVWITASGTSDTYDRLPFKTLSALRIALTYKDWDFLIKVDDDTFVHFDRLKTFLNNIDPKTSFYGGLARHRQKFFPDKKVTFIHGGTGYILTRSALLRAWNNLEDIITENENIWRGNEDVALGMAMYKSKVEAFDFPDLFFHHYRHLDTKQTNIENIMNGGIATHPIDPRTMKLLHALLSLHK